MENDYNDDYDYYDPDDSDDDSGNESDTENYYINRDRLARNYDLDDFISDPDSEAEPDEGIEEDLND